MTPESTIVVERRKELTYLLCQGAELEHGLMCQYLYAAFSLKTRPGPGVRPDQLEAIERWRSVILAISREEMLHWSMIQNLLTAVGSAPFVSRPHMPHQAKGYPPGVQLRLLPFGEAALQHFVYLERPEGMEISDAAGFEHDGLALTPMAANEIIPRSQHFATQGDLYRSIETGLVELARKFGEDQLFIGPVFHQEDEEMFRWPELEPIVDLDGAIRALDRIVENGEGTRGEWSTAHFGRFLDVLREYQAMRSEDPQFEPAHPVAAAGMRAVEGVEPDVHITDPITGLVSDLFNATYELLLQMIARYFAFGHETPEQRAVLARAAVDLMFSSIDPLGLLLAELDVGPDHPGVTAGANFQLPYRSNFLLPHRRSAWIRFVERLRELAEFAHEIGPFQGEQVVRGVADALDNMARDLAAHIEAV
jgi:Ferritin-like